MIITSIEFKIPTDVPLKNLRLVAHCVKPATFISPTEEEQLDALIDRALGKAGLVKVMNDDKQKEAEETQ